MSKNKTKKRVSKSPLKKENGGEKAKELVKWQLTHMQITKNLELLLKK